MQVTVYQIMTSLGLVNSLAGYILLQCGTDVISIYIFLQFFENLSVSLDESAILEGCTYFGVFFRILFPLLRPAIVTVMILKGIGVYNEYYSANLYLQDKTRFVTVSTALYTFTGPFGNAYNLICAGVILTLVPKMCIRDRLTRHLIERGHKRIAFVGSAQRTTSIMDRYSGYLRAMMFAGLTVEEGWLVDDRDSSGKYLTQLTLPQPLPTAFVCNNDQVAMRLVAQL